MATNTSGITPRIRLAIIGGGIAGCSLANALGQIPHLEIQVYEAAPEFSERGAAVGLTHNAQLALAHVLPSAKEVLEKAGAVPLSSSRVMIGSGQHAGAVVFDVESDDKPSVVVHRASLLRELLAPLPKEILHGNKKLVSISNKDGAKSFDITFEDGTTEMFDAVIGADGVFGPVPSPAGVWDCRNVVPFEKAIAVLGEENFRKPRQYGWCGDGAFIMHDVCENGTMVQCVMSALETDPPKDRKRPLTREILTKIYSSWLDGPIANGAIDIFLDQPNPSSYSEWEHKSTSTYANGHICIMGDAAHATTPWQGSGAGMAIEDAMVLAALLGDIRSSEEIDSAFKAFDAVRRSRCQQIIDSSRGTGLIMCGQDSEVGLDPEKIREKLSHRWDFIVGLDHAAHKQEAVDKMREIQGK
ncbi:6-methylsalicylic acid decarboxylase atA [Cladobotryum mycophilum]|uniref:6-methylsalicylic acid decarboxylase atA n=1 Tax=Cladobotryum mycophilum TaxID=491253 RepID=A0ABR0SGN5_9HYPO